MSDLHHVVPDRFPAHRFSHLLPSLDRHRVTTSDILTLDAVDLAKRAQVPVAELRKLHHAIVTALHADLGLASLEFAEPDATNQPDAWHATEWRTISTLDDRLDAELGGGVPAGYLTEITGESGAGKTQFLLTLLFSAQLPAPHGLSKSALYISTEAPLATTRLAQLLSQHPRLSNLPAATKPSLSRILSIQTPDLESQDHILRYQLPVAIQRHNVGLVVLDSVAANYRAEFDRAGGEKNRTDGGSHGHARRAGEAMAQRTQQLVQLGALLRSVARAHGVAVVVANQVSDRFSSSSSAPAPSSSSSNPTTTTTSRNPSHASASSQQAATTTSRAPTPTTTPPPRLALALSPDPLTLDHQQRWFTGWGDDVRASSSNSSTSSHNLKTPALGLVWANQIAARVALLKAPVYGRAAADWPGGGGGGGSVDARTGTGAGAGAGGGGDVSRWRRWMKVVFAPWAGPSEGRGVEYVIRGSGVVAVATAVAEEKQKEKERRAREASERAVELGGGGGGGGGDAGTEKAAEEARGGEEPLPDRQGGDGGGGGGGGDDIPAGDERGPRDNRRRSSDEPIGRE
ncbi:dna repair protein rad57 [Diplodia corticola]|uniref:Dna repair protein rad57 n=1 Tax=Diplodia corticola TaxID=236234 RepID=A0A1J9QM66_9PEZI|nr:dna repair protein rad57 [Diplodia corticola]OJD29560.1 dna repair protein rad57 [Diplodia corticola]